jgi:hypothetical protein
MPREQAASAEVSVGALTVAVEAMMGDPDQLKEVGRRARVHIWSKGFTWDQIVQQYKRLMLAPEALEP